ncbi:hypothetical protein [Streptomyces sp. RFCAC02]|uniref:hypothetical protein n=1 Tax=Streptomyces sp. RFCAC02 TaxID=2499143 RepID=UPI001020602E|nr:hypothetical protein [Streptomyces sp. RFCAC02]
MTLNPYCGGCGAAGPALTVISLVQAESAAGWAQHACRPCLLACRLIPVVHHPVSSWGEPHQWPEEVPDVLVERLADLAPGVALQPVVTRLFVAVRAKAVHGITAAVDALRAAVDAAPGPLCMYCETTTGPLTTVAAGEATAGPGRGFQACHSCLVEQRLVPFLAHPSSSRGDLHYWPDIVPTDLVRRLADLDEDQLADVQPAMDRLWPAATLAAARTTRDLERDAARAIAADAVDVLRTAVRDIVTETDR